MRARFRDFAARAYTNGALMRRTTGLSFGFGDDDDDDGGGSSSKQHRVVIMHILRKT